MIYKTLSLIVSALLVAAAQAQSTRPQVVVLTDFPPLDVSMDSGPAHKRSDPDDVQSMVRFLLYANDFEVKGLVASSATFANIANKQNLLDILNLYDAVDENLRLHDARYPTAEQLRAVTWQGASQTYGRPAATIIGAGQDSEASEKIIALLETADARPVWFCVWGGPCDLAQALWKIKETRSAAEAQRMIAKARVYLIAQQDGSAQWLLDTFPQLFVITAKNTWMGIFGSSDLAWLDKNVRREHGPLGAVYPPVAMGTKPGIKEGDSPSFMHLVSAAHGLNDPENPAQSSWGGQFVRVDTAKNHWSDASGAQTIRRWNPFFDNDFAARLDWCVQPFKNANHAPIAKIKGAPLRAVKPGETITLEADATDPDGQALTYKWMHDNEADSATTSIAIANSDSPGNASFTVPTEPGKEISIVLQVTDNGTPPLVGYGRLVCRIR